MKNYQFILSLKEKVSKPVQAIQKSMGAMGAKVDVVAKKLDNLGGASVNRLKKSFSGLPTLIAGAFAVNKVVSFGSSVVDTLAQFEKMEAVLTNTLGTKSKAQAALQQIKDFAASTPFQVDELSESFVKLANQNFRPTLEQMRQMGDLAAANGKSYNQLTEAVIDAGQSEFERLKEFGIKAKKLSKEGAVEFRFKGVTTKVKDNELAIRDYILALGDLEGVQGGMAAISETTGGKLSNLADKFTNLKLSIGEKLQPVISMTIDWMSKLVDKVGSLVTWLSANQKMVLKVTKVTAKLLVGYVALTKGLKIVLGTVNLVRGGFMKLLTLFRGFVQVLSMVRNAMLVFNAVMLANPIGAIIVGITALGVAVYAIVKYWDQLKAAVWAVVEPLVDLIDTIFPGFKQGLSNFAGWFKDAFLYIYSYISPVVDAMKWLGSSVSSGVSAAKDAVRKKATEAGLITPIGKEDFNRWRQFAGKVNTFAQKRKKITGLLTGGAAFSFGEQKKIKGKTGKESLGDSVSKGLSSVVGDQRSVKNININIGKLVEQLIVKTTTFKESPQRIKSEITKALIQSVNDVNYAT